MDCAHPHSSKGLGILCENRKLAEPAPALLLWQCTNCPCGVQVHANMWYFFPSSLFSVSPSQRQLGICSDDKFPFASRKNDSELQIYFMNMQGKPFGFLIRPLPSCMVMKTTETEEQQRRQPHECQDGRGTHFGTGSHLLLTSPTPPHPYCPCLAQWGDLTWICACLGRNHLLATFFSRWGKECYSCNSPWSAITD